MNLYHKLLNLGVDASDSDTVIRKTRSLNFVILILSFLPFPYLVLYAWLEVWELVILEVITILTVVPTFYITYLRQLKMAMVYCYFLNVTFIFLYSTSLGHEAGLLLFYLIAVFLPLFYFDVKKDRIILFMGYSLTFFYCLTDFYFNFKFFGEYLVDLETRQFLFLSYVPSSFLLAIYTTYQVSLSNRNLVESLNHKQDELRQSLESKEILIQDIDFANRELQALIENTHDEVFAVDQDGCYIIWNQVHKRMSRMLYNQLPEKNGTLCYFQPPNTSFRWQHPRTDWKIMIDRCMQGESATASVAFEIDGHTNYVDYSILPIRSSGSQNAVGVVIRGHDVTDLTESRDQLKSISERLKLSVDTGGIGIWEYDYQLEQFYFSRIMHQMFDIRSHNRFDITRQWYRLVAREDRELLIQSVRRFLSGATQADQLNLQVSHKDGSVRIIQTNFYLIRENNKPYKLIGSCLDITENENRNKELEKALKQAERTSEAKSDFLSVMSHEIRTPLNAIVGISDLLAMEEVAENKRHLLDSLKFSSKNLLGVIDDILEFNRIEAGKVELWGEEVNLAKLLNELYHMHGVKAQQAKIKLVLRKERLPDLIVADENKLSQCLNNLLSNAIKFTHEGSVTLRATQFKEEGAYVWLRFEVIDTGIGIAPDMIQLIFDKYTQVDAEFSRRFEGSGLGLAITQKLVDLMGGNIQAESAPGEGSTFSIELPFLAIKSSPLISYPPQSPVKTEALANKSVLIAEDNQLNRTVLGHFCSQLNMKVSFALNGLEAIRMAERETFDLILMDIQMPKVDGIEASEIIRDLNEEIPILALSANVNKRVIEQAKSVGINDYLTKPVEFEKLVDKMYEHLVKRSN